LRYSAGMADDNLCRSCFAELPSGAKQYCSNACRQRAYRVRVSETRRQQQRQNADPDMADIESLNLIGDYLHPDRLEAWTPKLRALARKVLTERLDALDWADGRRNQRPGVTQFSRRSSGSRHP
jgi:hypothetical protein